MPSSIDEFWSALRQANDDYSKRHGYTDTMLVYKEVGARFQHYMLPPPNEFVFDLADLQFGRKDYFQRNMPEYGWVNHQRPINWREIIGDKWAMYPIHEDIEEVTGMRYHSVYDPHLLESMLCQHPEVVKAIKAISDAGFRRAAFKPLTMLISRVFRGAYRLAYQERMNQPDKWSEYARGAYSTADWETRWKQACKQFDQAIGIVSEFLVRHYTLYPDQWVSMLAMHVDLSEYHRFFTGSKTFFKRPAMVRIKDHSSGKPDAPTEPNAPT